MKTLLMGGTVINVFTGEAEKTNVLFEDDKIIGVGEYTSADADNVEDVSGKYICPGFIDGHIHIESTMLTPAELAKVCLLHGTTAIVADPHEIANVCGNEGISYILEASKGIMMQVYIMLPSCVPSTKFDEAGAKLSAEDLEQFYSNKRVLGLAEVMNYPGVIAGEAEIHKKIAEAHRNRAVIDGHAPLLSGRALDKYISAGIQTEHECSSYGEAIERIRKGQWVMIRQGTAARNLEALIDLFDEPYSNRCLLVTDDRHPADLIKDGDIDNIIRSAVKLGKSAITGIQMATIRAAQCFNIKNVGAVAPGYRADILVLNSLEDVDVCDVYCGGKIAVKNKKLSPIEQPPVKEHIRKAVKNSFYISKVSADDFYIEPKSSKCRVIKTHIGDLITDEEICKINWEENNGISIENDILKIAVVERHMQTGHRGVGFISGIGLKRGAICSSVSHDSHNIVVIGANSEDMAAAVNEVISMGGGAVCVCDKKVLSAVPLPIAGLMAEESAEVVAEKNENLRNIIYFLGVPKGAAPLMAMSFVSLAVIPSLKMTTHGLINVDKQELVSLYI